MIGARAAWTPLSTAALLPQLSAWRTTRNQGRPSRASFELDAKIKTVRYVLAYTYPEGGLSWPAHW